MNIFESLSYNNSQIKFTQKPSFNHIISQMDTVTMFKKESPYFKEDTPLGKSVFNIDELKKATEQWSKKVK